MIKIENRQDKRSTVLKQNGEEAMKFERSRNTFT